MRNKLGTFTAAAAIFILLAGFSDFFLQTSQEEFTKQMLWFAQSTLLLNYELERYCVDETGEVVFGTTKRGFRGECGVIEDALNPGCFFAYGANFSPSDRAIEAVKLITEIEENKDSANVFGLRVPESLLKTLKWIFMTLALIFSILAFAFGLKWD